MAALALVGAATAFDQAYPKTATPAAGSTVQVAPSEVAIEYDDELGPKFSAMQVQDANGVRVGERHRAVAA